MKNLMAFPSERKMAWAVAGLIFVKVLLCLILPFINPEESEFLVVGIDVFTRLIGLFVILYLISFLTNICGTRTLNFTLYSWAFLHFMLLAVEIYFYSINREFANNYLFYIGCLFLLVETFLVIKIFMLSSMPYKKYLTSFGVSLVAIKLIDFLHPIFIAYVYEEGFNPYNLTAVIILDVFLHQLPILLVAILSLAYITDSGKQQRINLYGVGEL